MVKNREWDKGKGGGVMIGIKRGIKWKRLTLKQMGKGNREMEKIGIKVKGKTKDINIIEFIEDQEKS